jgi:hypothetical protein
MLWSYGQKILTLGRAYVPSTRDHAATCRLPREDRPRQGACARRRCGGYDADSDFSWQVVGTYGFDVNCFANDICSFI